MAIPESQLETWSHQGTVTSASEAYESIKEALYSDTALSQFTFEIYLQGSYRNDTNIRGDSDVDVIVQLNSAFQYNLSSLGPFERLQFSQSYSNATHTWSDFRARVLTALRNYYRRYTIVEGNKSLKVPRGAVPIPTDVVVAQQYRRYERFNCLIDERYIEGMTFYVQSQNRWIVNYPKLHYDNGVTKNSPSATNGWFKPTTRVFKNARRYLVDNGTISPGVAPSYFVECFIYNAPATCFGGSYQSTYSKIVEWMMSQDLTNLLCQHRQEKLCSVTILGIGSDRWPIISAQEFIRQLIALWNNWH